MQGIGQIIQVRPVQKQKKVERWQDEAAMACKKLADGWQKEHKASIFKKYKENAHMAAIALQDALELQKPYAKYFFKVFSELNKRV